MKRTIAFILAFGMCLSLCACGKSSAAKAVDEMILAIGEVTSDSASAIEAAVEAYDALSAKDQESIENYAVLQNAQEELFYVEFYDLANSLLEVYYNCQYVSDGTRIIWDNVGNKDFWTCYNAVLMLDQDLSKSEYDEKFIAATGVKAYATIWCAARGLCPSNVYDTNKMSDEGQEKTIDLCYSFNQSYKLISEKMDPLSEAVRIFKTKYKNDFEDEIDTINEMCLELSMYVDFALEPSGSLNSYTSQETTYHNTIDRLVKILDSYK